MEKKAWQAKVHRVAKSWTQLSMHALYIYDSSSLFSWLNSSFLLSIKNML